MRSLGWWLTAIWVWIWGGLPAQQVSEMLLCENVVDNDALGIRDSFWEDERGYVWLKIEDITPPNRYVQVDWIWDDRVQHTERLAIRSTSWRTHCYKTLYRPGTWQVIVTGSQGDTLGSRLFEVFALDARPLLASQADSGWVPPPPAGLSAPAKLTYPTHYAGSLSQPSTLLGSPGGDSAQPLALIIVFPGVDQSAYALWQQWLNAQVPEGPEALSSRIRERALVMLLPERGSPSDQGWEGMPAAIHRYEQRLFADLRALSKEYPLATQQVLLLGQGWGADLAWAIGQRYPDQFAGAWLRDCRCSYYQRGSLEVQATQQMRYVLERDTLSEPESLDMLEQALRQIARAKVSMQVWQPQDHPLSEVRPFWNTFLYLLKSETDE